ncbi:MAG TPA: MoxR family ATPase [Bacillota bacterium]|nr:MoxR family ATPase [Bacillota bacterium]
MEKSVEIINEVKKAIVGKDETLIRVYLAIIAGGHILMEDIPGVGKTTMALAFSKALALSYSRMQFTPDVLPSDIVGFSVYDKQSGSMEYKQGAVMANLFLADELNRATSRTQSALLEAMEEGQVTVDGVSHTLPEPFLVIATQNPKGAAGTQLLPDSQIDRFMIRISLGYPDLSSEVEIVKRRGAGDMLAGVRQVITLEELNEMKKQAAKVYIDELLLNYIVNLVAATRNNEYICQGASPRASLAIASMAKATAWLHGRDYIVPGDVKFVFHDCIEHRLILTPEGEESKRGVKYVTDKVFSSVFAPPVR